MLLVVVGDTIVAVKSSTCWYSLTLGKAHRTVRATVMVTSRASDGARQHPGMIDLPMSVRASEMHPAMVSLRGAAPMMSERISGPMGKS